MRTVILFITGFVVSCGLAAYLLLLAPAFWKAEQKHYTADRLEKACDAVTSLLAFLIPAVLAIATWVYEKTNVAWYGACLALGVIWFLFVLIFTMYVRFNFIWRFQEQEKVNVGQGHNLEVVRWLTVVMFGLTVGLVSFSVPTFAIAFWPHSSAEPSVPAPRYEFHVEQSRSCPPAPPTPEPKSCKPPEKSVGEK